MAEIVPAARPQASRSEVSAFVGTPLPPFPFLVARRGYYGDAMGAPNANDINLYDDAMWLVEEDRMTAWNANCDPSRYREGMASLKPGRWLYKLGIHNLSKPSPPHIRYPCLVQAADVTVSRFGQGDDTGQFGIHIHHGGENTTTSEGCQTIPPAQWPAFFTAVASAMNRYNAKTIPYILTSRY